MTSAPMLKVGTLGSATTFAGEATSRMRELHPEFRETAYFPSLDGCWQALVQGAVDVVVLSAERSGQPHQCPQVITHGLHVAAELALPLECNLYVRPGTQKRDVRRITGHGSIHQCVRYLDREFPGVPREAHGLNSVEAARAVLEGDGTLAVVGTLSLPAEVGGLEVMDRDIGDGAIANWWAVSREPRFSDEPDTVVIAARCGPEGQLGALTAALREVGFLLRTAAPFPVNAGVSTYDYLLTFTGRGRRAGLEQAISSCRDTRLAGADALACRMSVASAQAGTERTVAAEIQ